MINALLGIMFGPVFAICGLSVAEIQNVFLGTEVFLIEQGVNLT